MKERIRKMDAVIASVREEVVLGISNILVVAGGIVLCVSALRDWRSLGTIRSLGVAMGVYAMFVAMHFLRRRIPVMLRGGVLVGGLAMVAISSMLHYGAAGVAVVLLPTALLLSWMVFGRRLFLPNALMFLLVFAGAATFLARDGASTRISSGDIDARPTYWLNMAMMQGLAGLLIIDTLRRLLRALLRRASQARERRDHYQGLLEGLQEAVFVHAVPDGTLLERNRSAERMFGIQEGSEARRFPWAIEEADAIFGTAVEKGMHKAVCRSRRKDGEEFWSEVSLRGFRVGSEARLVAAVRDVDDRIRHQIRLKLLNQGLDELVALRTEDLERSRLDLETVTEKLACELRDPLVRIGERSRQLRLLLPDVDDGTAHRYLQRIDAGTRRMETLIEVMLGLSKIDHALVGWSMVDMGAMARECCEEIASGGNPGKVEWVVEPLPACLTDAGLVRQVWANLVSNAFKYAAREETAHVRLHSEERDDGIWYVVTDDGPGFEPAQVERMFQLFQRLHTGPVEGLGIGLASVRRVLGRLGGAIEAHGRPGQGASFRFRPYPPREPNDSNFGHSAEIGLPSCYLEEDR